MDFIVFLLCIYLYLSRPSLHDIFSQRMKQCTRVREYREVSKSVRRICTYHFRGLAEPVFVILLRSPGIDPLSGGPERQPYMSYRPTRLHRLTESISRNRFLGFINVYTGSGFIKKPSVGSLDVFLVGSVVLNR